MSMDLSMGVTDRNNGGVAKRLARRTDAMSLLLRRWGGCWIDLLVIAAAVIAVGLVLRWLPPVVTGLTLAAIILAYYPVMEVIWGRTVGKFATGIVVVDENGNIPGIGPIILRTLLRLVEVNPLLMGGVPAGIAVMASQHRQRLGDMAAGTYVVLVSDLERVGRPNPIHDVFD